MAEEKVKGVEAGVSLKKTMQDNLRRTKRVLETLGCLELPLEEDIEECLEAIPPPNIGAYG